MGEVATNRAAQRSEGRRPAPLGGHNAVRDATFYMHGPMALVQITKGVMSHLQVSHTLVSTITDRLLGIASIYQLCLIRLSLFVLREAPFISPSIT